MTKLQHHLFSETSCLQSCECHLNEEVELVIVCDKIYSIEGSINDAYNVVKLIISNSSLEKFESSTLQNVIPEAANSSFYLTILNSKLDGFGKYSVFISSNNTETTGITLIECEIKNIKEDAFIFPQGHIKVLNSTIADFRSRAFNVTTLQELYFLNTTITNLLTNVFSNLVDVGHICMHGVVIEKIHEVVFGGIKGDVGYFSSENSVYPLLPRGFFPLRLDKDRFLPQPYFGSGKSIFCNNDVETYIEEHIFDGLEYTITEDNWSMKNNTGHCNEDIDWMRDEYIPELFMSSFVCSGPTHMEDKSFYYYLELTKCPTQCTCVDDEFENFHIRCTNVYNLGEGLIGYRDYATVQLTINHSYIDVINTGSLNTFTSSRIGSTFIVTIVDTSIDYIQPGALQYVPTTFTSVVISGSQIGVIKEGALEFTFGSLRVLHSFIGSLQSDCLKSERLNYLYLQSTEIVYLFSHAFSKIKEITEIQITYTTIHNIDGVVFSTIEQPVEHILITNCFFDTLPAGFFPSRIVSGAGDFAIAFSDVKISNFIEEGVLENLVELDVYMKVEIESNSVQCNDLLFWMSPQPSYIPDAFIASFSCHSPLEVAGDSLVSFLDTEAKSATERVNVDMCFVFILLMAMHNLSINCF